MDSAFLYAHHWLGQAFEQKGMLKEAIAEFKKATSLTENPLPALGLAHAYAVAGKKSEALKASGELEKLSARRYISSYYLAAINARLGEIDRAFEWLEKAFVERSLWLIYVRAEPMFDALRADPRFHDLIRRVGLPL